MSPGLALAARASVRAGGLALTGALSVGLVFAAELVVVAAATEGGA
ncbi:hypothetical protein [Streptomyces sp. NPDC040750]